VSHVYLFMIFLESSAEELYYCYVTMHTCCRI